MHSHAQIKENDFESALQTFGVQALLYRVMRVCNRIMLPLLTNFRRSWQLLEIDRVRRKNPGLTMGSASALVGFCRLLDPPEEFPNEKGVAEVLLRGPRCSVWNSVLALRELGAFTDDLDGA